MHIGFLVMLLSLSTFISEVVSVNLACASVSVRPHSNNNKRCEGKSKICSSLASISAYATGISGTFRRIPSRMVAATSSRKDKKLSDRDMQVINFFAGGLAGTISSTLTAPLEIVKTQLQASVMSGKANTMEVCRRIYQDGGAVGFFKGIRPLLVGIIPTRAIYFSAYSATKEALMERFGNSPLNHVASAFAAGIASNTVTNPLWMVKTRFQLMADTSAGQIPFKNYKQVVRAIWKEEGGAGFFKGLSASYFGCIEGAIQWMLYEKCKTMIADAKTERRIHSGSKPRPGHGDGDKEGNAVELFAAAAVAKTFAVLLTYPHEVVRTRLREQAQQGVFKYNGFLQTLTLIAKEEGRTGLYSGMGLHLLRSVPNAAIMFVSFELVSSFLKRTYS